MYWEDRWSVAAERGHSLTRVNQTVADGKVCRMERLDLLKPGKSHYG